MDNKQLEIEIPSKLKESLQEIDEKLKNQIDKVQEQANATLQRLHQDHSAAKELLVRGFLFSQDVPEDSSIQVEENKIIVTNGTDDN